jgi:hypothetical protein
MIKSFSQFINESTEDKPKFIKDIALKLLTQVRQHSVEDSENYSKFSGMHFTEPYRFDLKLELKKDSQFTAEDDPHFKNLPWEQLNFKEDSYSIDANTRVHHDKTKTPEIIITLVINPNDEPHLYRSLHARLVDILTHETNHLDQNGPGRDPFSANPTIGDSRNSAKKSYEYFLLPDEIESMVEGMFARAQELNQPLDAIFDDYLQPFVKSKYINPQEYDKVMQTWVKYAIERYPEVNFSKNVEKIVNSI